MYRHFILTVSCCGCIFSLPEGSMGFGPPPICVSPEIRSHAEYHPNGHLKQRYQYYLDTWSRQHILHGRWTAWRSDGTVREERTYEHGELSGSTLQYDRAGRLRREISHREDQKDGTVRTYDSKGRLRGIRHWEQGLPTGPRERFSKQGELKSRKPWVRQRMRRIAQQSQDPKTPSEP
ncbi:hypothetical protein [Pontibacter sp. G13]|uniref:toxin-antitoxin system YwqK family antitoxin n=1 Tax=Pontibacter sp. G13 TaxID=3074898 RepID=UPI002889AE81|nr:hypothetical protein [Pontibacter sp. G13]WNJ21612.1 hypothetical protein RJD25_28845 [Pontibacter sp. G13]